jgi:fatty acid desaturase
MEVVTDSHRELRGRLQAAGAFDRKPLQSIGYIAFPLALLVVCLSLFMRLDNRWLALADAVFFAFISIQFGFVMHDAGHGALFRHPLANKLAGLLAANLLAGLSFGWWVSNHNRHHAHPNTDDSDPDLDMIRTVFALAPQDASAGGTLRRFLARHQVFLAPLLSALQIFGLKYYGFQFLASRPSRHRISESILLLIHHVAYFGFLIYFLGSALGLCVALIHHLAAGFYLTAIVSPNHIARPTGRRPDEDPILYQIVPSRNVRTPVWLEFLWGGLNYQIEHHLFPAIGRGGIRRALPVVKRFCEERNLPYHETTFLECYSEIFGLLESVSSSVRGVAGSERTRT